MATASVMPKVVSFSSVWMRRLLRHRILSPVSFLLMCARMASSPQPDLLTGVSLTLPDGTTVSFFIKNDWRKAPSSYPISDPA